MADEPTQQLRLLVRLRITLGRQRARAKNQLQAVLHQEGFKKPVTDVFGKRGRAWLAGLELSVAGRLVVETWLREVDHLDVELGAQTRELERMARADARARFLQTVPGIGAYAAMVILAELGDVERFGNKRALASYAGLTPVVRSRRASASEAGLPTRDRTRCAGSCCRWRRWRRGARQGRGAIMRSCARGSRRRWPGLRWRGSY